MIKCVLVTSFSFCIFFFKLQDLEHDVSSIYIYRMVQAIWSILKGNNQRRFSFLAIFSTIITYLSQFLKCLI